MKKRRKVQKEKTLLRKFIEVSWEQIQRRKALKILSKQEWSMDFLTALLARAGKYYGTGMELIITSPSGATLTVKATDRVRDDLDDSDDVFQHLDDDAYIDEYVARHGR